MFEWLRVRRKKQINSIGRAKNEFEREIENLIGKKEYDEFKKFAFKKSMTEMAIAFMLGAAFKKLITSLSDNLVMPLVNFIIAATGEDWRLWEFAPIEGLTFETGQFLGSFVDFILLSIILYLLYRKFIAPILAEEEKNEITVVDTIECPNCYERVFYKSKVCKFCTREIKLFD